MASTGLVGRIAVLVALALTCSGASGAAAVQSQAPSQTPAQPPPQPASQPETGSSEPASDASRVKRALEQPSSGLLESAKKKTERVDMTFRVNITEKPLNIWDFWGEPADAVAPYVGSWYFSNWHQEFLRMVTPDYARRAALYPQGMVSVPILPSLANAVKTALRVRAERRAKEEVQDALEQFFREHPEAQRPPPSLPPGDPPGA